MAIERVVVLMLENRSFDSMMGLFGADIPGLDGLIGNETNPHHTAGQPPEPVQVNSPPGDDAKTMSIPTPDPGEGFDDIHMQLFGLHDDGSPRADGPNMSGFVDNYAKVAPAADLSAVMHAYRPEQIPAMHQLATAYAVSDRWFASAPCQTWPNRFFAHTATGLGYRNNSPTHFPYRMETVFNRLNDAGKSWRIYYHDIAQATTLSRLWGDAALFRPIAEFKDAAANGRLPEYCFIEPRYFAVTGTPNDQHPPHHVGHGDALIADVYNAVRASPQWPGTLLIVTYDEHGGCYDHVPPPPATRPDGHAQEGFAFDRFGVRVPALIICRDVKPASILRPSGDTPFDHTSIIATLGRLHGFAPLTERDKAAPNLIDLLDPTANNDGPTRIDVTAPTVPPDKAVAIAAARPNPMQQALSVGAALLPTRNADVDAHADRLAQVPDVNPRHVTVADASVAVRAHMDAFVGSVGGDGGAG